MSDSFVILGVDPLFGKSKSATDVIVRRNVIPLNMFGTTLRGIIDNVAAQINARDAHLSQQQQHNGAGAGASEYNPKILENLIGIEDSVFRIICTSNNGGTSFDNVHIFTSSNTSWIGI